MHRISQKFGQNVTLLLVLAGVPIKKGVVDAISAGTFVGISKERAFKQEKLKEAEVEGSVEVIGPETKKRKTGKSQKQLALSEEKEI